MESLATLPPHEDVGDESLDTDAIITSRRLALALSYILSLKVASERKIALSPWDQ